MNRHTSLGTIGHRFHSISEKAHTWHDRLDEVLDRGMQYAVHFGSALYRKMDGGVIAFVAGVFSLVALSMAVEL